MTLPIKAPTKLAAVVGWPVAQSLSPLLHTHWLKKYAISGAYIPLPVRPEDFGRCTAALPLMGFAGVSVTVPHKQAAFALCREVDEDARATGAVNTLIFAEGGCSGMNTDVRGFAASLAETLGDDVIKGGTAVVLGAGGAARAVVLALARLGAGEIRLVNRTAARAEALGAELAPVANIMTGKWQSWERVFAGAHLLVNTTSLGMVGKEPLDLPLNALPQTAAIADIVYNPLATSLLRAARARGHRVVDGLGMLMHQAAPAFEAWFGVRPAVTRELRDELVAALDRA